MATACGISKYGRAVSRSTLARPLTRTSPGEEVEIVSEEAGVGIGHQLEDPAAHEIRLLQAEG